MSQQLISLNPALKRLRDEGYEVSIAGGYLIVGHIPYVTSERQVEYGILASSIEARGDLVSDPGDHTVRFAGSPPCTSDGMLFDQIIACAGLNDVVAPGVVASYMFSSKPAAGKYANYHEKMTTYINILQGQASVLDPGATARTYPVIHDDEAEEAVFKFMDTASSRAGINALTEKLARQRIAIVGVGGTGSYILDFVAKTPVAEIHLYDADDLLQHNAFRMPGALEADELRSAGTKVAHLSTNYSKMRHGIVAHERRISEANVHELGDKDFVFLSLTDGEAKRLIIAALEERNVPFVDCGMGIYEASGSLGGQVRTTTSTPSRRDHIHEWGRIPFSDGEGNEYSHNIQIVELNALNAAMAVIKWKKTYGFYLDLDEEHHSVYVIDGNQVINEDTSLS